MRSGRRRGHRLERGAHVRGALGDGLLGDDLAAERLELVREDLCEGFGVAAAVMDGGGRLDAHLVERELSGDLALEGVVVRRSGVARIRRVAILGGQRRAGVGRRDRRQARFGDGLDATDDLVGAGGADEPDEGAVGRELGRRGGAALGGAQAVFRGQLDVVTLERAAQVVDGDLDALLGVLTQGRIGPGQDAPVGDVDRLAGRDLDGAERIVDSGRRAGRRRWRAASLAPVLGAVDAPAVLHAANARMATAASALTLYSFIQYSSKDHRSNPPAPYRSR